jgi:hypothetical protein
MQAGYLVAVFETAAGDQGERRFFPEGDAPFTERTCLLLTPAGFEAANRAGDEAVRRALREQADLAPSGSNLAAVSPRWQPNPGWLWWDKLLVKRVRRDAVMQRPILDAFEEERTEETGWPPWVYSPLPRHPNVDPKARLDDALRRLNGAQAHPVLRFYTDVAYEKVYWQPVTDTDRSAGKRRKSAGKRR